MFFAEKVKTFVKSAKLIFIRKSWKTEKHFKKSEIPKNFGNLGENKMIMFFSKFQKLYRIPQK